jgi:hypothetical protein
MSERDALVVGRGLPAYLFRIAILAVGGAIAVLLLGEGTTLGTFVLLIPAVLASAYAPGSPTPAVVVVVAAVLVALGDSDPFRVQVLVLIPLVHAFHVLCGIADVVPASGRLHPGALRGTVLRFLLIQAVMAVVVVFVALLPATRTAPLVETIGLVGLALVAVLVVWLQRVK